MAFDLKGYVFMAIDPVRRQQLQQIAKQMAPSGTVSDIAFQGFLDEALTASVDKTAPPLANLGLAPPLENNHLVAQVTQDEIDQIEVGRREDQQQEQSQLIEPTTVMDVDLDASRLAVTPFQLFLDKAVDALQGISDMEQRVNDLTDEYIDGKASIDDVSIATTKLNLSITFATTVITTATTTLKEIINMQI